MWNTYFALYGTEQTVAAVEPIIRVSLTASGGEVLWAPDPARWPQPEVNTGA